MKKKINICLIPARAGSRRLKNKNILKINNKPIISHVINNVKKTNIFNDIFVSTNSDKIKKIALKNKAKVVFKRPENISNSKATDVQVINHFLNFFKSKKWQIDNMLYIYPTAIFTNKLIIKKSFNYFKNTRSKKLLLITEFNHPIERAIEKKRNKYKFKNAKKMNMRSQELKKYYHDTGMLYFYQIKNYSLSNQKKFNALIVKNFSYGKGTLCRTRLASRN